MTGFARVDGAHEDSRWTFEIKSVNGRGLEPRFRLPPGFEFLEQDMRKALVEYFSRGSVNVFLALGSQGGAGGFVINRAALEAAIAAIEEIRSRIDCERPRAEGLLALKGVVEPSTPLDDEEARAALGAAILESFRVGGAAPAAARRAEGAGIEALIAARLDEIEVLTREARASAEAAPEAIRDRLKAQIEALLADNFPADRLAQEVVLLAVKADIREELDRLDAHVAAGRALLKEKGAVGRKLDFLTQEFNREANTLGSKAQDMGLKRISLDLKTVIDQLREQAQNVE